ncbi:MAG TPA: response regulator transcription factor [Azospirillaceae bacterium]|nr:response regulator transcription factor [Azospirillaceae bacterium]
MPTPAYEDISVLVVDDEMLIRQLLKQLLRQAGFSRIGEAEDVPQAWKAVLTQQPDVIVCDIGMEPQSGMDFLRQLKASPRPEIRNIPLIFLTVQSDQNVVVEAISNGAAGYLLKPIAPKSLLTRIDQALGLPPHRA